MKLVDDVEQALWAAFPSSRYFNVEKYIEKWQTWYGFYKDDANFFISKKQDGNIDLKTTLHNIDGETLLKIAIDLGVDTPDFIPSIPTFKNELKSNYKTAYDTFVKAYKQIEADPSAAIAFAYAALESIIKEILKDANLPNEIKETKPERKSLSGIITSILRFIKLYPNADMPKEINTICNSLITICKSIEDIRSDKTGVAHGKTTEDYLIQDSLYAYFVVNSIATVGLFLNSYFKKKFSKEETQANSIIDDVLPF
jgi:hypothetical protein